MSSLIPSAIIQQSTRLRPAMVDMLQRLVLAESPTGDRSAAARTRELLEAEFQSCGYRSRRIRGSAYGDVLFAAPQRRSRARPLQMLVGHYDTVWPLGTLREMPLEVEPDVVRGPGAFDMKAGLVQLLTALRIVHDLQLDPSVTPVAVLNADEELGSRESTRTIRRVARRAVRAFVMEPAFGLTGKLKTARKGVGSYELTIKGRAAHAGIAPEQGVSAILEMSYQVQRLFALNDPARGITVNVGTIDGGLRSNVVAPEVKASIDVRVPTLQDADEIDAALRALTPLDVRTTIKVEGGFEHPPLERLPRNQVLWRLAENLGAQLGLTLEQAAVGGASDGNTISQYTATLDGLGAVGDGAHAAHEFVDVAHMVDRTALLVLLLMSPCT